MTQLVVYAYEEKLGECLPAYAVCVAEGRAEVRAFRKGWQKLASAIEAGLNRRAPATNWAAAATPRQARRPKVL